MEPRPTHANNPDITGKPADAGYCPPGEINRESSRQPGQGASASGAPVSSTSASSIGGATESTTRKASQKASEMADRAKSSARETAEQAKTTARETAEQAKRKASEYAHLARDRGQEMLEGQKHRAADQLHTVGAAVHRAAEKFREDRDDNIAGYVDALADEVDHFADYLDGHDVNRLVRDTQSFARREPEWFLGGMFLAGLALTRFLKSSGQRDVDRWSEESRRYDWGSSSPQQPWTPERPMTPPGGASAGANIGATGGGGPVAIADELNPSIPSSPEVHHHGQQ